MSFFTDVKAILDDTSSELSRQTFRTYFFVLQKFNRYAPALEWDDFTADTIKGFREYMRTLGNNENTVCKTLATLKNLVNKYRDSKNIERTPFKGIKIGHVRSLRQYLSLEELGKLFKQFMERHGALSRPQFDALQAFLFSCYTGLRYSDLKSLSESEIANNVIRKQMHKTKDIVYIPLTPQAKELIALPGHQEKGHILRVTENTYFNRHLKEAAKRLGFDKHIHCHMARHTFATACLTLGIPLEVTSKLLGHRKIETTLIYARVVNNVLNTEMLKFNQLGGFA